MKCRVSAARRPMHTAGAALLLLLLLLLLFLFISRNVWPISRLDAPQGTEARQREKQREWEGGVGHRGLRPVSEIMSTLVATYARAGIATLWPVCTGNGSRRKAGRSGQGQGQGTGHGKSIWLCVCRFQNGNYLPSYLPAGQRLRAIRFFWFSAAFFYFHPLLLLILGRFLFNSCFLVCIL